MNAKPPRIIAWEITRSCNLACAHCRASAHCEPYPGELTLDQCKGVIDDIASICSPILILTGGEPLMRKDIFEIIDYARERGLHPVIGTNGTLIDDECASRIAEHGIPRVSVSLDFPDMRGQDAFRGQDGAFEATLRGMRNLRAHGVEVQVNTTVTKLNGHLLDDMHDLALDEGAVAFHPFLLVPTGRGEDLLDVELSPQEYEEVLTWAYHRKKTSPMHFKPTDAPQYYRIIRQLCAAEGRKVDRETYGMEAMTRGCLGGISFAFISHVGDVQPCGYFDMQLGNVLETPFSQIWETSPVFADLRNYDRLRGKCGECEFKAVCGGCRARALAATGDYLAEEPYCAYVPKATARTRILGALQRGLPLEADPYGVLAADLGLSRETVLDVVSALCSEGTIRRIGASFSSAKLGFASTLCAMSIAGDEATVDRVADAVNAHQEITHNYLRDGAYNLWFTVIAPTRDAISYVIGQIEGDTGYPVLDLPAKTMFKVRVDFSNPTGSTVQDHMFSHSASTTAHYRKSGFSDFDKALIKWAQGDALGDRPFSQVPGCADEQAVLKRLREWADDGTMRRFGAIVRHRKLGYDFNGMTVWDVPSNDVERMGRLFASLPYVSHCYERSRTQGWHYNLYAMVHAKTQSEFRSCMADMSAHCPYEHDVLLSLKEYKKTSPVYFD